MTMPSDTTVQAWIRLARAYSTTLSEFEKALSDNKLPPLNWYDILLELERVGDAGLRQFELESALLLKQYGVSRLVERIEREGYLRRELCKTDGRGKRLIITSKGREIRQRIWQIYGLKLQEVFGQRLSDDQCRELSYLLKKLDAQNQLPSA